MSHLRVFLALYLQLLDAQDAGDEAEEDRIGNQMDFDWNHLEQYERDACNAVSAAIAERVKAAA